MHAYIHAHTHTHIADLHYSAVLRNNRSQFVLRNVIVANARAGARPIHMHANVHVRADSITLYTI